MGNPFHYGGPITGPAFINRKEELKQLSREMTAGQKVFLISPRRYGKTSLLLTLAARLKRRGCPVAFIDLFRAGDVREFLSQLSSAVLNAAERPGERALRAARDLLPRLRPRLEIGPDGKPTLSLELGARGRDLLEVAEEVLELPERLAKKRGKPFAVFIDECQELSRLDGEEWEKKIRAVIQHHRKTGYVFSGSAEHLLTEMVEDRSRAFYRMGRAVHLALLPPDEFSRFIVDGFADAGVALPGELAGRILEVCEGYPYNVQYLSHTLWSRCQGRARVRAKDLEAALSSVVDGNAPVYASLWERFTRPQRGVLKVLAVQSDASLFATETRRRHGLGPSSTVDAALKSLVYRKGTLRKDPQGRYAFCDPFLREWVGRKLARS